MWRVVGSRHCVGGKNRDFVEAWSDLGRAADAFREVDRGLCWVAEVVGLNPEEEPDDGRRAVTDSLVDAVVAGDAGQCLAVVVGKKSVERD